MIIEAVTIFRAVLLGIKIIYNRRWLYCNLKLINISLINKPLYSVLLDINIFKYIQVGGLLQFKLGTVGTIGYFAPQLKLEDYNHFINIWSISIILFKLMYNYYLQKFSINLQYNNKNNKKLCPFFGKVIKILLIKWLGIIRVRVCRWLEAIYIINILYHRALIVTSSRQANLNLQLAVSLLKQ